MSTNICSTDTKAHSDTGGKVTLTNTESKERDYYSGHPGVRVGEWRQPGKQEVCKVALTVHEENDDGCGRQSRGDVDGR